VARTAPLGCGNGKPTKSDRPLNHAGTAEKWNILMSLCSEVWGGGGVEVLGSGSWGQRAGVGSGRISWEWLADDVEMRRWLDVLSW